MIIRWHPIPGLPGYEASNHGKIRSRRTVLKQNLNSNGRLRVTIRDRHYTVHVLVALAFLGPRPEGRAGEHIRHLDCNPHNNRPDNLAYGTHKQNNRDPYWNWRFRD